MWLLSKGFHEKSISSFFSILDQSDRECLWIIEAPKQDQIQISLDTSPSDCPATSNHIYIYDGLPSFISRDGDSQTLGVFCPTEPLSSESTHRKKVCALVNGFGLPDSLIHQITMYFSVSISKFWFPNSLYEMLPKIKFYSFQCHISSPTMPLPLQGPK